MVIQDIIRVEKDMDRLFLRVGDEFSIKQYREAMIELYLQEPQFVMDMLKYVSLQRGFSGQLWSVAPAKLRHELLFPQIEKLRKMTDEEAHEFVNGFEEALIRAIPEQLPRGNYQKPSVIETPEGPMKIKGTFLKDGKPIMSWDNRNSLARYLITPSEKSNIIWRRVDEYGTQPTYQRVATVDTREYFKFSDSVLSQYDENKIREKCK